MKVSPVDCNIVFNMVSDPYYYIVIFPCIDSWPWEFSIDSHKWFCWAKLCWILQYHLYTLTNHEVQQILSYKKSTCNFKRQSLNSIKTNSIRNSTLIISLRRLFLFIYNYCHISLKMNLKNLAWEVYLH